METAESCPLYPKSGQTGEGSVVRFVPEADLRTAAKQSLFEVRHALGWSPPATCGHCANVTVVAGGRATSAGTAPGRQGLAIWSALSRFQPPASPKFVDCESNNLAPPSRTRSRVSLYRRSPHRACRDSSRSTRSRCLADLQPRGR